MVGYVCCVVACTEGTFIEKNPLAINAHATYWMNAPGAEDNRRVL